MRQFFCANSMTSSCMAYQLLIAIQMRVTLYIYIFLFISRLILSHELHRVVEAHFIGMEAIPGIMEAHFS
jgi:hypothetical protein